MNVLNKDIAVTKVKLFFFLMWTVYLILKTQ